MNDMEMKARANHKNGNNCSNSIAITFADTLGMTEAEAKKLVPAPRSIEGMCGGYLSVLAILRQLGIDKEEEYKDMFLAKNGSLYCKELIAARKNTGRTCNDIVGESAAMLEELINRG